MQGAGHSTNQSDPEKLERWKEELAQRVELSPEQLLGIFNSELINWYDRYQQTSTIETLLAKPLPPPKDNDEIDLQKFLQNNVSTYDEVSDPDEFWDALYRDNIVTAILNERKEGNITEESARILRVRLGIVAHYLFSVHAAENPTQITTENDSSNTAA